MFSECLLLFEKLPQPKCASYNDGQSDNLWAYTASIRPSRGGFEFPVSRDVPLVESLDGDDEGDEIELSDEEEFELDEEEVFEMDDSADLNVDDDDF